MKINYAILVLIGELTKVDDKVVKQKSNLFLEFLLAWVYIFLYALKGLRFIIWDLWVLLLQNVTVSSSVVKTSDASSNADDYERTKGKGVKKQKYYNYSPKKLAKYEKMKVTLANDLQMAGATRSKTPNIYQYTVRNVKGDGKIFTDTMSGFSKLDINSFLVNEGYEVYDIKTSKTINFLYQESSLLGGKMRTKDLVFWLTQLSTYLKAGIPLNESVRILTLQMKKDKTKLKMMRSLSYELSLGEAFSAALEKQGNVFPALLINMIKAAEATGTLQETLEDMASYYTEVDNTNKEMKSAMTYPAIITVFAIAVVTFIIIYVVPQFTKIYSQNGITITGVTAMVIKVSDFLSQNLILVIALILLAIVAVFLLYKKIKAARMSMQIAFMHVPVFKDVLIYKEISIFAKTFASLLRNNVFITDSMDILSKITNNEVYKAIMYKTINNIVKGEKISDAFKDHWAVPDVAYYMIVTGESTGQLGEMMQKVSDYYQTMHKNMVNSLKSLIEPIMIVFLAVMVAIILIAVIVPMFQLYSNML